MKIPIYEPWLTNLEKDYAKSAIDSTWISSNGKFIAQAEEALSEFYGAHVVVSNNGTTALHLCCLAAGMRPGAKVLLPSTTYAATAFAPSYCGAQIEFVDSDPDTWNMDLNIVEKICQATEIDFVIPVHLLGNPVDMHRLDALSKAYGFVIIEDACESIGATINGKLTGTFGRLSALSFYGNKTFTSGEGGAVISTSKDLATNAKMLRGQAQSFDRRYWHLDIGYNYRMTNIQAAILCAQLCRKDEILAEKARVAEQYSKHIANDNRIKMQKVLEGHIHGNWMITVKTEMPADSLAAALSEAGVETRPMFYPLNEMPPFRDRRFAPVSKELSERCLMLPSSPLLSNSDINFVCSEIKRALDATARTNNSRPI